MLLEILFTVCQQLNENFLTQLFYALLLFVVDITYVWMWIYVIILLEPRLFD